MNIGTIIEAPMLTVKFKRKTLGRIEENFIINLSPGDTFIFGGEVLHTFSFAMIIGVVVGTYSSIFVASPVVIYMNKN